MASKNEHFGELEYCFNQYFSKYIAPIITKDYKYYKHKQSEELQKAYNAVPDNAGSGSPMQGFVRAHTANVIALNNGAWSKKNLDDFLGGVSKKIENNPILLKDWAVITDKYEKALIAKLGVEKFNKLGEELGEENGMDFYNPAYYYAFLRLEELKREHLARLDMPKSSSEYLLKKSVDTSIFASIMNRSLRGRGLTAEEDNHLVRQEKLYQPSTGEKVGGIALGTMIDAPGFVGTGTILSSSAKAGAKGLSNVATKVGLEKTGSWLGQTAAAKGTTHFGKEIGTEIGFGTGFNILLSTNSDLDAAKKAYSERVFGESSTIENHQKAGRNYRKSGTEYISNVNNGLVKNIKPGKITTIDKSVSIEKGQLLTAANGKSSKLLNAISSRLHLQGIYFKNQTPIPAWMLQKSAKECRALAATFFSAAKNTAEIGAKVCKIGGKNMSLSQVAQRAFDYARAAVEIEKRKQPTQAKQSSKVVKYSNNTSQAKQETPMQSKQVVKQQKQEKEQSPKHATSNKVTQFAKQEKSVQGRSVKQEAVHSQEKKEANQAEGKEPKKKKKETNKQESKQSKAKETNKEASSEEKQNQKQEKKDTSKKETKETSKPNNSSSQQGTAKKESVAQPSSTNTPQQPKSQTQNMATPTQPMNTNQQAPQTASVPNMSQNKGWTKYLDNTGLNGFSDISKDLGYVFAMLPDMLIGMFTGRNMNFTIDKNILPLASIAVGLFTKNPLLKLMFMGFGGANLLNNAGHDLLGTNKPKEVAKNYKQYADEALDPRMKNVYLRGRSLIADIDNRPVVINISDKVIDAFEKKAIPLNTLANAVLRKYDESRAVASSSYDRNLAEVEQQDKQQAYGLK